METEMVSMALQIPKELSQKLSRRILELSERGVRVNKQSLLIRLAWEKLNEEMRNGQEH